MPDLLPTDDAPSPDGDQVLDEAEAKRRLAACGVEVPVSQVADNLEGAVSAAGKIGFPVAVKALGLAHKTGVGGVRLDLRDETAVAQAVTDMASLADSFLVESMVEGAVAELIVGVARDPQFGPYLLVGGGGILVELLRDSKPLLLPTSREAVRRALDDLQCAPLIGGFRGGPAADVEAAIEAILAIARWVESDPAAIAELDINPLLLRARDQGAVAVDALLRLRADTQTTTDN